MAILNHLHSYVRLKNSIKGFNKIFRCIDPDCTHYSYAKLIIGKRSLCAKCGKNEIILNRHDLLRAIPLCIFCSNSKRAKISRTSIAMVEEVLSERGIQ